MMLGACGGVRSQEMTIKMARSQFTAYNASMSPLWRFLMTPTILWFSLETLEHFLKIVIYMPMSMSVAFRCAFLIECVKPLGIGYQFCEKIFIFFKYTDDAGPNELSSHDEWSSYFV